MFRLHITLFVSQRSRRGYPAAIAGLLVGLFLPLGRLAAMPTQIEAPGETLVVQMHAEGAQIYECKPDTNGKLVWQFREPIATLLEDGKTVGRHFAGPTWALGDGSSVAGKAVGSAPGDTAADIPWLRLDVVQQHGSGRLTSVDTVQRINTKGGLVVGPCTVSGSLTSAGYSADYVFLRRN